MDTAKSFDSYKETLREVLDAIRPRRVLEFGSGKSTYMLSIYPSVLCVTSVEHDKHYYEKTQKFRLDNLKLLYMPDLEEYATRFPQDAYDFVFVDGRNRAKCLESVKGFPVVMLHDAKREHYQEAIRAYKHVIWTDEGHTATLTNSDELHARLMQALRNAEMEFA